MSSVLKTAGIVGAFALALGYMAGVLPERNRRMTAEAQATSREAEIASIRQALTEVEGRARLGNLLGRALMLMDLVAGADYGRAQQMSSEFFDAIRAEAMATSEPARREVLMSVLSRRDALTAGLAKADPAVVSTVRTVEQDLRRALGYPVAESGGAGSVPPSRP